jgi:hypothetical protein
MNELHVSYFQRLLKKGSVVAMNRYLSGRGAAKDAKKKR